MLMTTADIAAGIDAWVDCVVRDVCQVVQQNMADLMQEY